jgi:hypothetical protein
MAWLSGRLSLGTTSGVLTNGATIVATDIDGAAVAIAAGFPPEFPLFRSVNNACKSALETA